MDEQRPSSAIPPVAARVIAFVTILLAGSIGGLIGYFLGSAGTSSPSPLGVGIAILIGSVSAAGGTAVVAVLGLRAMGEWNNRT